MNDKNYSIESAGAPLAYVADDISITPGRSGDGLSGFRTVTRALTGMQKEALVANSACDPVWRMVSDEGPYLNGTDLAPAPLAFFSAGMAASYTDAILGLAGKNAIRRLKIRQENRYRMDGSAIQGTMIGSALPVELAVSAEIDGDPKVFSALVADAVSACSIESLMRDPLIGTFSVICNGERIPAGKVAESANTIPNHPDEEFTKLHYNDDGVGGEEVIKKLQSSETVSDPVHGAGASMKETQKRELLVRSDLSLRSDGLREVRTQIVRPVGSMFRFLAADPAASDQSTAPSALAYVSAGLAFCFMTQLGRYAGIIKKDLAAYGVVQDTCFEESAGKTYPVDTHTFIDTSDGEAIARQYVDMGEQTCFLHAACRTSNESIVRVEA